mmetsp:Transcript_3486/g.9438  ORF Transcript_3486/g.9438 Transcript_3486/m.9438 type:complete len:127 (-) Transcript_3486:33-413(-)|eukprot:CAMPEP_0119131186 /NCGR_PEP_ID=MMETSP1310-20130426/9687_1 /TAXON_ID=464262 /ORGANISM="Genus nov. species nov., Strain RCC2339" /LENGTH=126 /DNA_ID=CAMNT_0007121741 /DNA_START=59 /DNA_END=439 /DNA_ORIENTATION=-
MLRLVFARSAVMAPRTAVAARPYSSDSFNKRERALEESYAKRKEAEALQSLAEKLRASNVDTKTIDEIHGHIEEAKDAGAAAKAAGSTVSIDEIFEMRKELVKEVRDLEDVVADLKYRVQQLEKKR